MITADALRRVPQRGESWDAAESVKARLKLLADRREPYYLVHADLTPVLEYKLRRQLSRTAKHRSVWTDHLVKSITRSAFAVRLPDKTLELRARVAILTALPGVGVPVASAILALSDPAIYGIIDFRNWRQLFGDDRRKFSLDEYVAYMREVWRLARELEWPAQVVDWCIWRHDMKVRRGRVRS